MGDHQSFFILRVQFQGQGAALYAAAENGSAGNLNGIRVRHRIGKFQNRRINALHLGIRVGDHGDGGLLPMDPQVCQQIRRPFFPFLRRAGHEHGALGFPGAPLIGAPVGHILHAAVDHGNQHGMGKGRIRPQLLLGHGVDLRLHRHKGDIAHPNGFCIDYLLAIGLIAHLPLRALGPGAGGNVVRNNAAGCTGDFRVGIGAGDRLGDRQGICPHFGAQAGHDVQALAVSGILHLGNAVLVDKFQGRLLSGHLISGGAHAEQAGCAQRLLHNAGRFAGYIRGYQGGAVLAARLVNGAGLQAIA